jgi:UDP-N-acetylglucosamine--N-acetylmuramyl-(pentapeptide) pyrophosphoryl-undecaprenol N-acetylglucosamine transferase
VYPALSILQALADDASPILWVGAEGGMEADLVKRAGLPFAAIPAAGVHGVGLRALPANLLRLARGYAASRRILREFNPTVLLFTGGYVAVPMALASRSYPGLLYVPDIEPGLALRALSRLAHTIALTTETSRAYFPAQTRAVVTGYPLRADLAEWTRERGLSHLNLDPGRKILLVTGGSKGARSLNRAVLGILNDLLSITQVVWISGQLDWPEVEKAVQALPGELAGRLRAMPYLHDMGAALASADLVLSRAGASCLGEYPFFGLPALLVPYPYAWRYQKVNAGYLVEKGAAKLLEDATLAQALLPAVRILLSEAGVQELDRMRQAMRALARPEAARQLAGLVRGLATGGAQ